MATQLYVTFRKNGVLRAIQCPDEQTLTSRAEALAKCLGVSYVGENRCGRLPKGTKILSQKSA